MTSEENEAAVNRFIVKCSVDSSGLGQLIGKAQRVGGDIVAMHNGLGDLLEVDYEWAYNKFDMFATFGLMVHVKESIARLREKMLKKGVVNG